MCEKERYKPLSQNTLKRLGLFVTVILFAVVFILVTIPDDFRIQPLYAPGLAILMDIIEDRHNKHTTIITSQVPVKKWHEVIGEKTVANAILDRIVHKSIRIELFGDSMRKKQREIAE